MPDGELIEVAGQYIDDDLRQRDRLVRGRCLRRSQERIALARPLWSPLA
jgi:hypothetical protein